MDFDATFLISALSFIVFVFIMNAVLYSPVLKIMKQREEFVSDNFQKAENLNSEAEKKERFHRGELETSRQEARSALDEAVKKINADKQIIIADYKTELAKSAAHEKHELKKSALEAKEILKDSIIGTAKDISEILLGNSINSDEINLSGGAKEEN